MLAMILLWSFKVLMNTRFMDYITNIFFQQASMPKLLWLITFLWNLSLPLNVDWCSNMCYIILYEVREMFGCRWETQQITTGYNLIRMSEQDEASTSSFSSPTPAAEKDRKYSPIQYKPCQICGGKATGYHFGVISCEACKVKSLIYLFAQRGISQV